MRQSYALHRQDGHPVLAHPRHPADRPHRRRTCVGRIARRSRRLHHQAFQPRHPIVADSEVAAMDTEQP